MKAKFRNTSGSKSGLVYSDPYLNLVRGIFERAIDDLIIESGEGSLKKARADAASFFFNVGSPYYYSFREWCELTGFSHIFWQQKAMMFVARKIYRDPSFEKVFKKYLHNPAVLAKIKTFVKILRKRTCWDIY